MLLKPLKVFCDVVSRRSFSKAADENGISQSGASQVVNQLEKSLGVKLIDRSKRPFMLTPEGEIYYDGCRKLVERYMSLEEEVRTLHEEVAGRVRVASIYSVGLHHMNRYLQEFLSQYPKANVRLEYLHPHRVYDAVESDQADLGLMSYPKSSRTIKAIPWREEPMVLVCAPGHRLAGRASVGLEELSGENVIGFDSELTIRREIDRALQLNRAEVQVVMEFDNIETIKRAIEIDAGVGLLPAPTVIREVEGGTLVAVPLTTDELVRPLGIIFRRGKDLGVTARRFIELLRNEAKKNPLEGLWPLRSAAESSAASQTDGAELAAEVSAIHLVQDDSRSTANHVSSNSATGNSVTATEQAHRIPIAAGVGRAADDPPEAAPVEDGSPEVRARDGNPSEDHIEAADQRRPARDLLASSSAAS